MHMAAARGARGARSWSSPSAVLSSNRVLLPSPDGATVAATVRFTRGAGGKRNRAVLCLASGGDSGTGPPPDGEWEPADSSWDGGRQVDEGMSTLRRRIREVRAVAASGPDEEEEEEEEEGVDLFVGGGDGLSREWTELERRHHGSYVAGVRVLQAFLMRARPGLGVGVVALALLGVPASVLLVSAQLIQAVDAIMSAVMNGPSADWGKWCFNFEGCKNPDKLAILSCQVDCKGFGYDVNKSNCDPKNGATCCCIK